MKYYCWRALFAGLSLFLLGGFIVSANNLSPCDFPAIYNFGDSNSDTGGLSAALDPFPTPPNFAGRASDGRLIIDLIAEHLNLPYLSAYLNSLGANFRHGANFAAGGATIGSQNGTFFKYGITPFSLDVQILQFSQFKERTNHLYNEAKIDSDRDKLPRREDFAKALYTFDIGENDLYVGFQTMSFDQLREGIPDMMNKLASAVQNIYEQGGRAFWIHNTGPIGCLPVNFIFGGNDNSAPGYVDELGCIKAQNDIAAEFNRQLKEKVIKLRAELPEAAITYVDIYSAKYGLISNAKNLGFDDPFKFCCGHHETNEHVWCGKKAIINNVEVSGAACKDPSKFVSFDGAHYTAAANQWVANRILYDSLTDPTIPITQACHRQPSVLNNTGVYGACISDIFNPSDPQDCSQFA